MRRLCWRLGDKPLILLALWRGVLVNSSGRRVDPSLRRRSLFVAQPFSLQPEALHICVSL